MDVQLNISVLALFIPTFFLVSVTPGMCMTLSMTLGMTIGVKRTMWMMWGELLGVAIVTLAAASGVAAMMLKFPLVFTVFKIVGGGYLCYLGLQLLRSCGKMTFSSSAGKMVNKGRFKLAAQGFITAVANPKGWAFTIVLLPPFIMADLPFVPQISVLLLIILCTEFFCLVMYASGGKAMQHFLLRGNKVKSMDRIAGIIMILLGIWLALG